MADNSDTSSSTPLNQFSSTVNNGSQYQTLSTGDGHDEGALEVHLRNEVVHKADVLYGSPEKKAELGRKMLLSSGKKVDYVLVYRLATSAQERKKIEDALAQPYRKGETKAVQCARRRENYEKNLIDKGVILEHELSEDGLVVYAKLHVPFNILKEQAEEIKLKMPLNEEESQALRFRKEAESSLSWLSRITLPHFLTRWMDHGVPVAPDYYSAPFIVAQERRFDKFENEEHFFTEAQRILCAYSILVATKYGPSDHQIGLSRLLNNGSYAAAYPLHDGPYDPDTLDYSNCHRNRLWSVWGRLGAWNYLQPLDLIRDYFGEKIALYFSWVGFYTTWLYLPAFVGILVTIYGLSQLGIHQDDHDVCESNMTMCAQCDAGCVQWQLNTACTAYKFSYVFDNPATIFFALFMSLWASVFMDFWRRRNAELAYDWDVMDLEEEEPTRPQFRAAAMHPNPVTGKLEKWYPPFQRYKKYVVSFGVVTFFISIVIIVVIAVIVYRLAVNLALYKSSSNPDSAVNKNASIITSMTAATLNLIGILFLNYVYQRVAEVLTDWENHQHDDEYEGHLTFKIFLFQFVNSYSSLFYIAFFKGKMVGYPGHYRDFFGLRQEECPPYGCFLELTVQLLIIMVGKQFINNIQEIYYPRVMSWFFSRKVEVSGRLPWEEEFYKLAPYPSLGTFGEYLELVIQFGFLTLFVAAFPLAPLFALLNNIMEIRVDADKLVTSYRRPPPLRAEDIGIWEDVLEFVSFFSVVTNGLVIALTSDYIAKDVYQRNNHGSMDGYIAAITPFSPLNKTGDEDANCHYIAMRDDDGNRTILYWEVIAGRLAFLVAFEHVVFMLKFFIQWIIPNVPQHITLSIQRENYLARLALEQTTLGATRNAPHHGSATIVMPDSDDEA